MAIGSVGDDVILNRGDCVDLGDAFELVEAIFGPGCAVIDAGPAGSTTLRAAARARAQIAKVLA